MSLSGWVYFQYGQVYQSLVLGRVQSGIEAPIEKTVGFSHSFYLMKETISRDL